MLRTSATSTWASDAVIGRQCFREVVGPAGIGPVAPDDSRARMVDATVPQRRRVESRERLRTLWTRSPDARSSVLAWSEGARHVRWTLEGDRQDMSAAVSAVQVDGGKHLAPEYLRFLLPEGPRPEHHASRIAIAPADLPHRRTCRSTRDLSLDRSGLGRSRGAAGRVCGQRVALRPRRTRARSNCV